jgi:hypothetical protein
MARLNYKFFQESTRETTSRFEKSKNKVLKILNKKLNRTELSYFHRFSTNKHISTTDVYGLINIHINNTPIMDKDVPNGVFCKIELNNSEFRAFFNTYLNDSKNKFIQMKLSTTIVNMVAVIDSVKAIDFDGKSVDIHKLVTKEVLKSINSVVLNVEFFKTKM